MTVLLGAACETPPANITLTDVEPALSHGMCLAQVGGGRHIEIVELNGNSRTYAVPWDLTSAPPRSERVSPDGTYLVSTSIDDKSVTGLNLDGRVQWQVPNVRAARPAISLDAKKVVLLDSSNASLIIYDVLSAQLHPLGFRGNNPAWAPDGDRLAYDDGANVRIHDTSRNTTVDAGPGTEPSWLPDGASIAVRAGSKIEVIHLASGGRATMFDDARGLSVPRWSPDGEWMYYTKRREQRWWAFRDWFAIEPTDVILRNTRSRAEASIAGIAKGNQGNYTWVTNVDLCRSVR